MNDDFVPTADVYMVAATADGSAMPMFTAKLPGFRRAVDVAFAAGVAAERARMIVTVFAEATS